MAARSAIHPTPSVVTGFSHISPDDYRVTGEKTALWIGVGILTAFVLLSFLVGGWLILPVVLLITAIIIWVKQGQLLGNAVKVSQNQFPEINEAAETAARRLGIQSPEVFIKFDPTINAFATGFIAKKSVILHSALVEAMQQAELLQVIGHEFSHIKCGHTNLTILTSSSAINVPVVSQVLSLIFLLWQRKAEYTCDRGGVLACRDPKAAAEAMCKIAVGPELFKKMDIDHFLKQQMDLDQNEVAKLSEILIDHPYLVRRIQAIKSFYESAQYGDLASRYD
jgi:Zn-dependent protease with chaperone function